MLYDSIPEFIAAKETCPICNKPVSLGIDRKDDFYAIKIIRYDEDILIQVHLNGSIRYSNSIDLAAKRFVTSKLLSSKKLNAVSSSCFTRVPVKNDTDTITSTHSEYYALWNVVLNESKDTLIGINLTHEIFRIPELDNLHELVVNYVTDATTVVVKQTVGRKTIYVPSSFVKINAQSNRDYLLRKIHTILIMKD